MIFKLKIYFLYQIKVSYFLELHIKSIRISTVLNIYFTRNMAISIRLRHIKIYKTNDHAVLVSNIEMTLNLLKL